MRTLLIALCSAALLSASKSTTEWSSDRDHSRLGFTASHLLISEINGEFKNYQLKVSSTKEDFSDAKISLKIDVKSIDTGNSERDNTLRSREFFNIQKYPYITFEGTNLRWVSESKLKLTGVLTINGISKVETFDVKYGGTVSDPIDGQTKVGFKLLGKINRLDYDLKWNLNSLADTYVVGEDIEITCNIRLNKPGSAI
ncbi:MAG TPA: YceI family protein [Luteibaculaceae bacterium]|nr:YceI family protein [Luteibaculaceae bacterium]